MQAKINKSNQVQQTVKDHFGPVKLLDTRPYPAGMAYLLRDFVWFYQRKNGSRAWKLPKSFVKFFEPCSRRHPSL